MRRQFAGMIAGPLGAALLAALLTTPAAASTRIQVDQALPGPDGNEVGETRIVVDGPHGTSYDKVVTDKVEIWVRSTLNRLPGERPTSAMRIEVEGEVYERDEHEGQTLSFKTQRLRLAFPYVDPLSPTVDNARRSPIAFCNQQLASKSGKAREDYLLHGYEVRIPNAYRIEAWAAAEWWTEEGRTFKEFKRHIDPYSTSVFAGATIECRPLHRPRAHTQTRTQGASSGRTGQRREPTVSLATLRMEAAAKQVIKGQLCPTQLRLYGRVQTIRAFEGKAVIFGPAYVSPVSQLNFTHGGNRNVIATYPLKWNEPGGLAAAGAQAPSSQSVSLTMNVTTMDNKVLKQAHETVTVGCRPVAQIAVLELQQQPAVPEPTPPPRLATPVAPPPSLQDGFGWDRMAAVGAPPAASFTGALHAGAGGARLLPGIDLAIRRVDRGGPGGATRLFVRNGGDLTAQSCRVMARHGGHDKWIELQSFGSVPSAPAPPGKRKRWLAGSFRFEALAGATTELAADLPRDPNLEFAVDCPGEPSERLGNNLAKLP